MHDLVQLYRVTPVSEVIKRWHISGERLDEIVRTKRLSVYTIREKRIRPEDGRLVYFCSRPRFRLLREADLSEYAFFGDDRGELVIEGDFLNIDDIEVYEANHPEILWGHAQDVVLPREKKDELYRKFIALSYDIDGSVCSPEQAAFPMKIFFTEIPEPNEGEYYPASVLMERYNLGPADFVEYLLAHKDLFPHGVEDWFYTQHRTLEDFGYGYQPMSRKVEALEQVSFHYRTIRNHEKRMRESGELESMWNGFNLTSEIPVPLSDDSDGPNSSQRIAELERQLAKALATIANFNAQKPTFLDLNLEQRQDAPESIEDLFRIGDRGTALSLIEEKDSLVDAYEKELAELKGQLASMGDVPKEEPATSSRWLESTESVCRAVIEVCKSGRTNWVKGSDKGGTTDIAGDELFSALVARLHTGKESVHTQAERAAWKAIADAGYTHSTGRKPAK